MEDLISEGVIINSIFKYLSLRDIKLYCIQSSKGLKLLNTFMTFLVGHPDLEYPKDNGIMIKNLTKKMSISIGKNSLDLLYHQLGLACLYNKEYLIEKLLIEIDKRTISKIPKIVTKGFRKLCNFGTPEIVYKVSIEGIIPITDGYQINRKEILSTFTDLSKIPRKKKLFFYLCLYEYPDLAKKLIPYNIDTDTNIINHHLVIKYFKGHLHFFNYACEGDHLSIASTIEYGNLDEGFIIALKNRSLKVLFYFLEYINIFKPEIEKVLLQDLELYLHLYGDIYHTQFFTDACKYGYLNFMIYFLGRAPPDDVILGFSEACSNDMEAIVEYMDNNCVIDLENVETTVKLEMALMLAFKNQSLNVVRYFTIRGYQMTPVNFRIIKSGPLSLDFYRYILSFYKPEEQEIVSKITELSYSTDVKDLEIIKLFIRRNLITQDKVFSLAVESNNYYIMKILSREYIDFIKVCESCKVYVIKKVISLIEDKNILREGIRIVRKRGDINGMDKKSMKRFLVKKYSK